LNRDKYKKKREITYDIIKEKSGGGTWTRCDMEISLNRYINKDELKAISNSIRNEGRKSFDNLCIRFFIGDKNFSEQVYLSQNLEGKWNGFGLQVFSKDNIKNIIKRETIYWDSLINEGYSITGKWTNGQDLIIFLKKDNKLFVSMKAYSDGKMYTFGKMICELYEGCYMATEYYIIKDNILSYYQSNGDSSEYAHQVSGKCDNFLGKWKENSRTITLKKRKIITADAYSSWSDDILPDKSNPNKFLKVDRTFKRHNNGTLSYKAGDCEYRFRKYGELETMWID